MCRTKRTVYEGEGVIINAAQIGPPGVGKTESLLTIEGFCKASKKPFAIIDVDGKSSDKPEFQRLYKAGIFELFDIQQKMSQGKMVDRIKRLEKPLSQEPKGWMEICNVLDELEANPDRFCGAALDTITATEPHIKHFIAFTNQKSPIGFEFAQWGSLLLSYQTLFDFFYKLPFPLKIINMHCQHMKNELTGRVTMLPYITGSFKDEAGSYPTEFFLNFTQENKDRTKPPDYLWRVAPSQEFVARSTVFKGQVAVPQDWKKVWETLL
jgi:hypothetical protein